MRLLQKRLSNGKTMTPQTFTLMH